MQVFQTDFNGFFVGPVQADPDPLTPGEWLVPGGCVTDPPPNLTEGQRAQWTGKEWIVKPLPEPVSEETSPPPIPQDLSFAQMLIGVVSEGWITQAEGEAWLTGTVPAPVSTLISQLPENQRFATLARAVRPSTVLRQDPLVLGLAALQGKTPQEMDAFFTNYSNV